MATTKKHPRDLTDADIDAIVADFDQAVQQGRVRPVSAEVLRVLTVCEPAGFDYYPTTLFPQTEAYVGACTAKTTIYCANIAAGFMLAQFTKYLRLLPVDYDIQVNLLASELNVGEC